MRDLFLDTASFWIIGINPGVLSERVDAPFAHRGNRFWPALFEAGMTPYLVDASGGLSPEDEQMLRESGPGFTNIVPRMTARAAELSQREYLDGAERLFNLAEEHRPRALMFAGIGAYRTAFRRPKAAKGRQPELIAGAEVWVVGNPSGLNAHETVSTLAESYRQAWTSGRPH
ncbi:mismatch-specific DNA-glycosylase [Corynebacterium qintianiae]|uniref:mismatch-specific DNA-glycosylase n=1 Tax=Corynebacterium qintianiae TaxID=2709392 RepID=UPI0013EDE4EC|nr:mismatch-specific DNA-glycosylase [Corynebacterium qintianiae]